MSTYVALLRGINVSGRNVISKAALQGLFAGLGFADVTTYIQSGNVVFTSPAGADSGLALQIEDRIARDLSLTVKVVIQTSPELAGVIAGNPFLAQGADPAKLHATFLTAAPIGPGELKSVVAAPDEFAVAGRTVYLHCPQGYGNTKLTNAFWERRLGQAATTRSWKTVTTLFELCRRHEEES